MTHSPIISRDELAAFGEELRNQGKKIVFTNGCFDILHIGHARYLEQAKALGDVLVIGVNTDASVKGFKGDKRPIVPEDERAELLTKLKSVDYVTIFGERLPNDTIALLKPDIHVKGGDYTIDQLPEAEVVHGYGGEVVIMPLVEGKSTTNVIKKIVEAYGPSNEANG